MSGFQQPAVAQPKHNKKSINRHPKKDLLKFCKENGIACNSKTSKSMLVAELLKNKPLHTLLSHLEKRKMSDKQKANLEKFRFKKSVSKEQDASAVISKPIAVASVSKSNPKSNVNVNPTSSNRNEPAPISLKQNISKSTNIGKVIAESAPKEKMKAKAHVPKFIKEKDVVTDFDTGEIKIGKIRDLTTEKDKTTRDKASFQATKLKQGLGGSVFDGNRMENVDSHTRRLLNQSSLNQKLIATRKRESGVSTKKSSDSFDRYLFNKITRKNNRKIMEAKVRAGEKEERRFDGELDEAGEFDFDEERKVASNEDKLNMLLSLQSSLKAGIITQDEFNREVQKFEEDVERGRGVISAKDKRSERLKQINNRLKEIEEEKLKGIEPSPFRPEGGKKKT